MNKLEIWRYMKHIIENLRTDKNIRKHNQRALLVALTVVLTLLIIGRTPGVSANTASIPASVPASASDMRATALMIASRVKDSADRAIAAAEQIKREAADYSSVLPQSEPVDESYFDDAIFIGDSRTKSLISYSGLNNARSYAYLGMNVRNVYTKELVPVGGKNVSVMEAIKKNASFNKAYIMLGFNELGWQYPRVFIEDYEKIIDDIRQINPDACIYVQLIIPVTENQSASDEYENNPRIGVFNELIMRMAEEKQVYLLDPGSALVNAKGVLSEGDTWDGIHLKAEPSKKWLEYLKSHTP